MPYRKTPKITKPQLLRAARQVANGKPVAVVCSQLDISLSTYMRLKRRYGISRKLRRERGRTYTNAELRQEMGLSREGIAGYIRDGLLPPPVGLGSAAHYTEQHLTRLRLLVVLKRAGIPRAKMPRLLRRLTPAKEKAIVRAAGRLAWGAPRVREWVRGQKGVPKGIL